ncbi:MAG TPA: extracellular solute-binding protein [Acidimicrobiales bacterium]|nr:extracellular solute-binding protein [Acidimicrobiales bacterium]
MSAPGPRRAVLRLLAALAVLALVAPACVRSERSLAVQGQSGPQKEGEDCLTPLEKADGPVELEVWHAINAVAKTTLEELADEFNASQDDVRVTVRSQGVTYGEVLQAYIQGVAGGQLPGLLHADVKDLQVLIDTRTLAPAQECFDAEGIEPDVIPAARAALSSEGTYWPALPTVSSNILYYNQSQFAAAGLDPDDPPGTLAEVEEAAEALKASGVDKPLALLLANGFVEYWVGGVGEQMVNHGDGRDGLATEATFDNPATREVLEWVSRMVRRGLAQPHAVGGVDQFLSVATEASSMVIETSTAATTIEAFVGGQSVDTGGIDAPELDLEGLTPAAGPFPGLEEPGQAQIGGGAFFIPSTNPPEVQAAAWAFSRFMASEAGQVKWHTKGSYLPVGQGVAELPAIREFWSSGLAGQMLGVASEQLAGVDPERVGPVVGPTTDYASIIEGALSRIAYQGASVDAVIAQADRELDAALERYAEDNAGG